MQKKVKLTTLEKPSWPLSATQPYKKKIQSVLVLVRSKFSFQILHINLLTHPLFCYSISSLVIRIIIDNIECVGKIFPLYKYLPSFSLYFTPPRKKRIFFTSFLFSLPECSRERLFALELIETNWPLCKKKFSSGLRENFSFVVLKVETSKVYKK